MSGKLKKMKLIPFEDFPENSGSNTKKLIDSLLMKSSPYLMKTTELDEKIRHILNSEIDEDTKVKLYVQELRKFLISKEKFEKESNQQISNVPAKVEEKEDNISTLIQTPQPEIRTPANKLFRVNLNEPSFATPLTTLRKKVSSIKKKKTNRSHKIKAREKIGKNFQQESGSSSEDSSTNWIPYNAAKKIKSIRRLKS
jgi:regulator of replication initiation timing